MTLIRTSTRPSAARAGKVTSNCLTSIGMSKNVFYVLLYSVKGENIFYLISGPNFKQATQPKKITTPELLKSTKASMSLEKFKK